MTAVDWFDPDPEFDALVDQAFAEGPDIKDCPDCIDRGGPCDFHRGFMKGWDDCSALVGWAIEVRP